MQKTFVSGLPFHVHGYFALDQNRRHIKLPGGELSWETITDPALLWNKYLITEALPKVGQISINGQMNERK